MPFTEDLDLFFNEDEFATEVVIDPISVHTTTVYANFSVQWQEINLGQTPYSGELPTLVGKSIDFDGKFGKTVNVGGVSYTIRDIRPDGSGISTIILTEQE